MSLATEKEFMERKDYLLRLLDSIEEEAEILLPRIKVWRHDLQELKFTDDYEAFDNAHGDLCFDLEHIHIL